MGNIQTQLAGCHWRSSRTRRNDMPRYGMWAWFENDDGTLAKVHLQYNCRKNQLPPACSCGFCADFLCDYPVGKGKTCDAPLCLKCRVHVGDELDYCKAHAREWRNYRNSGDLARHLVMQQPQNITPDPSRPSPQPRGKIILPRRGKR